MRSWRSGSNSLERGPNLSTGTGAYGVSPLGSAEPVQILYARIPPLVKAQRIGEVGKSATAEKTQQSLINPELKRGKRLRISQESGILFAQAA